MSDDNGGPNAEPMNQTPGIPVVAAKSLPVAETPRDGASAGPLSAAEHAELSAKVAASDNPGATLRDFWNARAAQAQPQTAQPQAPQNSQAPAAPESDAVDPQELDAQIREISEGRVSGAAFNEAVAFGASIEKDMAKLPDAEFNARFEAGIKDVISQVYGGDAGRFKEGLTELANAASLLCGGDKKATVEFLAEVDRSGALCNPAMHHKALEMARTLTGRRPSVFRRK